MSELRTNRIVPRDGLSSGSNGGIVQIKYAIKNDTQSIASQGYSVTPTDVSGLSVTITPTRSDSKILVQVSLGSLSNNERQKRAFMNIVRDSTNVLVGDAATGHEVTAALSTRSSDDNYIQVPVSFMVLDSPATTSATTYKVQLSRGSDSGTVYLNGTAGGDSYSGNTASTIIVMEVSG